MIVSQQFTELVRNLFKYHTVTSILVPKVSKLILQFTGIDLIQAQNNYVSKKNTKICFESVLIIYKHVASMLIKYCTR